MHECKIRAGREDLESGTSSYIRSVSIVAPHAGWQWRRHLCMTREYRLSAGCLDEEIETVWRVGFPPDEIL